MTLGHPVYPFNPDAIYYSKRNKLADKTSIFDSTLRIIRATYLHRLTAFYRQYLLNKYNKCIFAFPESSGNGRAIPAMQCMTKNEE